MVEQTSKEFLYYKVPVFVIDLTIHLGVLYFVLNMMPSSQLTGLDLSNGYGFSDLDLSYWH